MFPECRLPKLASGGLACLACQDQQWTRRSASSSLNCKTSSCYYRFHADCQTVGCCLTDAVTDVPRIAEARCCPHITVGPPASVLSSCADMIRTLCTPSLHQLCYRIVRYVADSLTNNIWQCCARVFYDDRVADNVVSAMVRWINGNGRVFGKESHLVRAGCPGGRAGPRCLVPSVEARSGTAVHAKDARTPRSLWR
ncbi:hypothetical protein E2C01_057429 [Portunus trituberculatus]|uniref:Uncharacterized protein n=1 Tax=Portunus trituberculatus TaxID=210409 RepID=A0A5B7GSV1_PORTR|nr:hypothetical protein [Portunus trituberculatus]